MGYGDFRLHPLGESENDSELRFSQCLCASAVNELLLLSREPPDADNPLLSPDLLDLPNYLLTPHIAWASTEAVATLARQVIENVEAFVAGVPRNRL